MPGPWVIITLRPTHHLPILLEKLRVTDPGDYTKAMLSFVYEHHNMFSESLIIEYCSANYIPMVQSNQKERPPKRRLQQPGQVQPQQQQEEDDEMLDDDDDEIQVIPDKGTGFDHTFRRFCPAIVTPHLQRGPKRRRV